MFKECRIVAVRGKRYKSLKGSFLKNFYKKPT